MSAVPDHTSRPTTPPAGQAAGNAAPSIPPHIERAISTFGCANRHPGDADGIARAYQALVQAIGAALYSPVSLAGCETVNDIVARLAHQVEQPNGYSTAVFMPLVEAVMRRRGIAPHDVLRWIFDELAQTAQAADTLCAYTCNDGDTEAWAAEASYLRSAICKVGWLADLGTKKLGGVGVRGDAEEWMLPPAYHRALEAQEREGQA
ncbi:hypothetical protein PIGHUM_04006 [Pigmentiphaga humi]|uniref:Uncharacterized protein n=1 Tax=Pigmentiphaga humi TaxID=2478468 RepID=A0A3P4B9W2_9BURK|nr:hypothetical protein [Pigmentiphaga humi]VCU71915.1 hypothetical protein PIGHUM_04006 [Pigmentiphaga humi]